MHNTSDDMPNSHPSPPAGQYETGVYLSENGSGSAAAPPPADRPGEGVRAFGGYELLEVIGRGRTGIVYRAYHVGLKRHVALKVMRAAPFASREERQRFRFQAETLSQLDHPHIVPLYEVGENEGHPYFTMKLIEGGSLAEHVADFANDIPTAARLVAVVARAIHHAHQHGILHRDLKPANILLEWGGEPRAATNRVGSSRAARSLDQGQPHVIDLGLAKRLDGGGSLTESGAVLGTPGYLAPEQTASEKAVTVAADIYGLGAILYELLTGWPPFRGETDLETLRQVRDEEPVRPRVVNPRIDRDLEKICLKCLEKEPHRRYGSAAALADDLERWLKGEPVRARPVGPGSRLLKWVRRRPAVAALLSLCVLLTAAGFAVVDWQGRQGAEVRAQRDEELYAEALGLVERRLAENDTKQAEKLLDACPRSARRWEWYCLKRICREPPLRLETGRQPDFIAESEEGGPAQTAAVRSCYGLQALHLLQNLHLSKPTLSRDGKHLAIAVRSNVRDFNSPERIDVWDVPAGRKECTLALKVGNGERVQCMVFSSDTRLLAVATEAIFAERGGRIKAGPTKVWDRITGKEVLTLPRNTEWSVSLAFSPDGQRLAALSSYGGEPPPETNRVRVWDVETGKELFSIPQHFFHQFVYTPDSQRIITAGAGEGRTSIRVWDARNGRALITLASWPDDSYPRLTLSPAGDRLAVRGCVNNTITIWDATPVSAWALLRPFAVGAVALALGGIVVLLLLSSAKKRRAARREPLGNEGREGGGPDEKQTAASIG